MRNTHKTIAQSITVLEEIIDIAHKANKEVVTYLSMGFGNPYGDPWNVDIVAKWTERLSKMGVRILSLSDTIGSASPEQIDYLFTNLIPSYPKIEFGAHLHTVYDNWQPKIAAAFHAGCLRFDGAIKGYGGCPMAKDELVGNMPTEKLLSYFTHLQVETNTRPLSFESAYNAALQVFCIVLKKYSKSLFKFILNKFCHFVLLCIFAAIKQLFIINLNKKRNENKSIKRSTIGNYPFTYAVL